MSGDLPALPDAAELEAALKRLADGIGQSLASQEEPWHLVAVANGGIALAETLAARLPHPPASTGLVNTLFFRDKRDLAHHVTDFHPTRLDFTVDDSDVVILDDVFATGRTARAALEELFAAGRPSRVRLAVWADVAQRVLPFAPDFVGLRWPLAAPAQIKLSLDPSPAAQHRASWKRR